jgi:tetratricopeptide (TPR) repeat protein
LGATYELGNAYLDLGKYAEAASAYEQTLKILNGEWEKSIPRFDEKYLPSPHFNMGLAHLGLGQKEQAVADFKKVIELKADFAEAYFNLGLTLWQLGRADEARATETKLRTLNAELAGKLTALFK